jgi:hypothetical protein
VALILLAKVQYNAKRWKVNGVAGANVFRLAPDAAISPCTHTQFQGDLTEIHRSLYALETLKEIYIRT